MSVADNIRHELATFGCTPSRRALLNWGLARALLEEFRRTETVSGTEDERLRRLGNLISAEDAAWRRVAEAFA